MSEAVKLHATGLQDLLTCPRLYRYRYIENLAPLAPSHNLLVGQAMHTALAGLYAPGGSDRAALTAYDAMSAKQQQDKPVGLWSEERVATWTKSAATTRKVLLEYFPHAACTDADYWTKVEYVEQSFEVPVLGDDGEILAVGGREVYHVGTFDLVVRDAAGVLWIVDHKSAASFPGDTQIHLDIQFGLYALAARYLWPDERLGGVVYNGIRKVDPARAKTDLFKRVTIDKTDTQLAHLAKRLANVFAVNALEGPYEPHPGAWCGWKCHYQMLCMGEERDADTDYLRTMNYKVEARRDGPAEDDE